MELKIKSSLIISDIHERPKGVRSQYYHDPRAVKAAFLAGEAMKVDNVVLAGDGSENAPRSPWLKFDTYTLYKSRELMKRILSPFLKWKMIYLAGNHELWTNKYLAQYDRETLLNNIQKGEDQFEKDYELKKMGIDFRPYRGEVQPSIELGSLFVFHGDTVNSHSAYTAKAVLDRLGSSVLFGHTHRLGSHFQTKGVPSRRKIHGAWENGCLCRLDEAFGGKATTSNWQQGCSIVHYEPRKDGWFHVDQIPIIDGRFMVAGKMYRS